jgi:hypothetical protein
MKAPHVLPGPARGRGRPPVAPGGTNVHRVTLDAATVATLRALGNGNMSAGIRLAAATVRARKRRKLEN